MKKLVAVLLAGVLMAGASLTAFAAGSPSATVTASGTDTNGKSVALIVEDDDTTAPSVDDEYTLLGVYDVYTSDRSAFAGNVKLNVPGVSANKEVAVYHFVNGQWKEETVVTCSNNSVTVSVSSLSPFAVFVGPNVSHGSSSSSTDTTAADGTTSPTTGETSVVAMACAVAVVAAFGMAVSMKKRNA